MEDRRQHDAHDLGAQTAWLRALAVRLVGDRNAADDLVQETFLVALRRQEHAGGTLHETRAWLHGIVRNVARTARRSVARRAERELGYAAERPSTTEGTDEVVERASNARRLFDAVLSLDEPYRTAVLLAYEERLDAPAIAARTGVSPVAARKRISRGVQMLRARVGADEPGRGSAWLLSLAGAVDLRKDAPRLLITGATMTMKQVLVAAAALLIAGLGFWGWTTRLGPVEALPPLTELGPMGGANSVTEFAAVDSVDAPELRVSGGVAQEAVATPTIERRTLRGRVLLTDNSTPVVGARVLAGKREDGNRHSVAPHGEILGRTDRGGGFEITFETAEALDALSAGLWVMHDDVFDVHVGAERISTASDYVLEVRTVPIGSMLVHVVDAAGQPAAKVRVQYSLKPTFGSDDQLWSYQGDRSAGTSDAHGDLTVHDLPVATQVSFGVRGEWDMPATGMIDPVTRRGEVTLVQRAWGRLVAQVQWPDGAPAEGVSLHWTGTSTDGGMGGVRGAVDASGRFVLADLSDGGGVLGFGGDAYHAPISARVSRGETTDLGTIVVQRPSRVSGRAVAAEGSALLPNLNVYALRDGYPVGQVRLQDDHTFDFSVPPGPLTLALARSFDWDPILPFRGGFLGTLNVTAPCQDVELPAVQVFAELHGRIDVTLGSPEVSVFSDDAGVDFGQPFPLGESEGIFGATWNGDRFTVLGSDAESVRVLLSGAEGRRAYTGAVRMVSGQSLDVGELRWARSILHVEVTGASGEPQGEVLVKVQQSRSESMEARTGPDGVATFELAVGPYAIRAEAGEGSTGPWQLAHVEGGEPTRVQLSLGEEAYLNGRVYSGQGPLEGVALRAQREKPMSNLGLATTTGPDGTFEFKPLLPGTYRYWIAGELVGRVELEPGASADLELELETRKAKVEVRREGKPFPSVTRLSVSQAGQGSDLWFRGNTTGPGSFEVALPTGPLEFVLDLSGLGNNQAVIVSGPPADGSMYELDLPETGIELRIHGPAAHGPCTAAYLLELDGQPVVTQWGGRQELYAEDAGMDANGVRVVRFPFLDPGARVQLEGLDGAGGRRTEVVMVAAGGATDVRWGD